jgi:hypothetical protein
MLVDMDYIDIDILDVRYTGQDSDFNEKKYKATESHS